MPEDPEGTTGKVGALVECMLTLEGQQDQRSHDVLMGLDDRSFWFALHCMADAGGLYAAVRGDSMLERRALERLLELARIGARWKEAQCLECLDIAPDEGCCPACGLYKSGERRHPDGNERKHHHSFGRMVVAAERLSGGSGAAIASVVNARIKSVTDRAAGIVDRHSSTTADVSHMSDLDVLVLALRFKGEAYRAVESDLEVKIGDLQQANIVLRHQLAAVGAEKAAVERDLSERTSQLRSISRANGEERIQQRIDEAREVERAKCAEQVLALTQRTSDLERQCGDLRTAKRRLRDALEREREKR